jgi:hypothetical protein
MEKAPPALGEADGAGLKAQMLKTLVRVTGISG